MSRELYLLRHAKSSWADPGAGDRDRELNNRGRRDAPRMGRALATKLEPMVVHASPARRAQQTLGGVLDGWPGLAELSHRTEEALYTFSVVELVDWIRGQGDSEGNLFLVGHNPAMTELVNFASGEDLLPNLPTAGFAHLTLDIERWSAFDFGCGRLVETLFPKELADA